MDYPTVTLCGSNRFKDEFLQVQKELTLQGYIVLTVGLFGHFGDNEVWEDMGEGTLTKTAEQVVSGWPSSHIHRCGWYGLSDPSRG